MANAATIYQTKTIERAALANTNLRVNLINTNLTGTNTAVRTLISDRYQVANVNTLLAAKATWTGLTGTNTALRTLINDRLQVANASATYLTKNNPVVIGSLTANGSTGTAGYYLRTSGAGVYWSPVSASGGGGSAVTATSQTFTGNGSTTIFTLSSSIADLKNVIVSINGLIQTPVTHYSISGTTLTFTSAPYNNSLIEARSMEGVIVGGGSEGTISSGDLFLGSMLLGGM